MILPRTGFAKALKYSLRSNRKSIAETQHPDRDQQFQIIGQTKSEFKAVGQPIISVDSKKKELIGNFKNPGKRYAKEADRVFKHDFRSKAVGIANSYGIYDTIANTGLVVVGTSHDTAEFAVESIRLWLSLYGLKQYLDMSKLLILCDSGGSNSYRTRLWK